MRNAKKVLLISLSAVILSNCSTHREFVSLPSVFQKEITSTQIYAEDCQKELQADVESSNISTYTGGGLLFALVDCAIMAHRENCASEAIKEIQKDFAELCLQEKFKNNLNTSFNKADWLHIKEINFVNQINKDKQAELIKNSKTDTVLISKLNYRFNPGLDTIKGTLSVSLYPTSMKLKNLIKAGNSEETPILKFNVSAAKTLSKKGNDMGENAKMWAQEKGKFLKNSIQEILEQIFINTEKILKDPSHLPEE